MVTCTGTVRRAVALGRFLQNPVAMVASLFGPSREILSVKFHVLQSFLSDEELYDVLERVMITVVNQVNFSQSVRLCILNLCQCIDLRKVDAPFLM